MVDALLINAGVTLGIALVCWLISLKTGDVSFVDAVWGGAMAVLALLSLAQSDQPGALSWLMTGMVVIWGVRLAVHMLRRYWRNGEDARYRRILAEYREQGRFWLGSLVVVWLFQGLLLFLVSSPAQVGIMAGGGLNSGGLNSDGAQAIGLIGWLGLGLWLVGIGFEWVGDWQLARFKGDPANTGKLMTQGLWRYTRHPNYFGDFCVWWGIWLACVDVDPVLALWTLPGPLFLTFTLTRWSGVGITERGMREKYGEEFARYVASTSAFVPLPPRNSD